MPDYKSIPNYSCNSDADEVTIEWATKNNYRIYSYPSPHDAQDQIEEAKGIVQFLKLTEGEFDIN